MPARIDVHLLPQLTSADRLAGKTVVMIDLLRAGTTIVEALASGARQIRPCLEVDEAWRLAETFPPDEVLLGGERGGEPIDGFQLGNSPGEYTEQAVRGKTIVFTTTNGTRALACCQRADTTWIGALVNLSALCRRLEPCQEVAILCAGTAGNVSRDDVLAAGAITYRLAATGGSAAAPKPHSETTQAASHGQATLQYDGASGPALNDSARLARAAWRAVLASAVARGETISDRLARELRETQGGRNLLAIGRQEDLSAAAAVDRHTIVPRYDPDTRSVRLP
ncbi:MAG: 2-phosphosulfolactate phosphatase [Pirellulales bacterium]